MFWERTGIARSICYHALLLCLVCVALVSTLLLSSCAFISLTFASTTSLKIAAFAARLRLVSLRAPFDALSGGFNVDES